MAPIGLTLGRYFSWRFVQAIFGVFMTVFFLVYTLDFVELMRRAGDVPNASAGLMSKLALYRTPAVAEHVLPVSLRALGLRDDTRLGKGLRPAELETIRVPTLAISARDDGYGTYAGAEYTASRIPGAKFIGYDSGGHLLVGRDEAVRAAIVEWLQRSASR